MESTQDLQMDNTKSKKLTIDVSDDSENPIKHINIKTSENSAFQKFDSGSSILSTPCIIGDSFFLLMLKKNMPRIEANYRKLQMKTLTPYPRCQSVFVASCFLLLVFCD